MTSPCDADIETFDLVVEDEIANKTTNHYDDNDNDYLIHADDDLYLDNKNNNKRRKDLRESLLPKTTLKSKSVNENTDQMTTALNRFNDGSEVTRSLLSIKIDRVCEFVQVLMHCLLYKMNYYDKRTHFEKMLKYQIIVYVIIIIANN